MGKNFQVAGNKELKPIVYITNNRFASDAVFSSRYTVEVKSFSNTELVGTVKIFAFYPKGDYDITLARQDGPGTTLIGKLRVK